MIKDVAQYVEHVIKLNPVFVVGSGLSAGAGISGMGQLAEYLVERVDASGLAPQDIAEWERIKRRLLNDHIGLESALQRSGDAIGRELLQEIVRQTWRCIANDEQQLLLDITNNADPTGFVRYFTKFKNTNNPIIHIITTNYDHLIEWSASNAGWRVWDGFHEGPIGMPLPVSELNEKMRNIAITGKRGRTVSTVQHHVRIYKPHGSLSWFRFPDGQIKKITGVGDHLLPMLSKVRITPTIVTPGIAKYLETHHEPYNNVLAEMKRVIDAAKALIFIGFGFNDLHIQGNFESVLRNDAVPKIIVALTLSDSVQRMIREKKFRNFVAVQQIGGSDSQTISDKIAGFITSERDLWTFKELLNQAWGDDGHARVSGPV